MHEAAVTGYITTGKNPILKGPRPKYWLEPEFIQCLFCIFFDLQANEFWGHVLRK